MKKVIIFQHGGGELANQLWNYVSVYAYCRERGYRLGNPSFFEYAGFFDFPHSNPFFRFFFILPFSNHNTRRNAPKRRLWQKFYKLYVLLVRLVKNNFIISSKNSENKVFYLPPSDDPSEVLSKLESHQKNIYFEGWLFRNPKGLVKHRADILNYFQPRKDIKQTVHTFLQPLQKKYSHIVGIHIRQGDYATFKDGRYFVDQKRVREIIDEYIQKNNLSIKETCFIIASDGKIQEEYFFGLNYKISTHNMAEDLFILSETDVVIGSDSSFGDFAAFYGNIPHIIFKNEQIDWEYYKNKNTFFENKYCTLVHY